MKNTTKWYRVKNHDISIVEFEVARFTDSSIWFLDHKGGVQMTKRVSSYDRFFPSRDEAVAHLRERVTKDIELYRSYVREFEEQLAALA